MEVNGNSPSLSGVGLVKTATEIQGRDVLKILESADASTLQSTSQSAQITGLGQNLDIKG